MPRSLALGDNNDPSTTKDGGRWWETNVQTCNVTILVFLKLVDEHNVIKKKTSGLPYIWSNLVLVLFIFFLLLKKHVKIKGLIWHSAETWSCPPIALFIPCLFTVCTGATPRSVTVLTRLQVIELLSHPTALGTQLEGGKHTLWPLPLPPAGLPTAECVITSEQWLSRWRRKWKELFCNLSVDSIRFHCSNTTLKAFLWLKEKRGKYVVFSGFCGGFYTGDWTRPCTYQGSTWAIELNPGLRKYVFIQHLKPSRMNITVNWSFFRAQSWGACGRPHFRSW